MATKDNKRQVRELVEALDIRPATLFEAINALKEEGIIVEPERKGKKTGRKARSDM